MAGNKNENPIAVYAVVSQVAFIVLGPLLIFVIGGSALVDWLGWAQWVKLLFMGIGIITMLSGSVSYLNKLIKLFDKNESGTGTSEVGHSRRDHDYYDDSIKKKRL